MQYNINQISAETLDKFTSIDEVEKEAITEFEINTTFNVKNSFSEINFFSLDNTLLLSHSNYKGFKILQGTSSTNPQETSTISIDPQQDIKEYMFDGNDVKILYNFLNNLFTNLNSTDDFIIKNISGDRTEIRLLPLALDSQQVQQTTQKLEQNLNSSSYFNEFSLYTQNNQFYTATNIKTQTIEDQVFVVIKLYQPLPNQLQINSKTSIVEQVADSVAFEGKVIPQKQKKQQPERLRGPNFSIEVDQQSNDQSQFLNYDELFSTEPDSSTTAINSLINKKSVDLSIDYSEFSDFINYSSAEERLLNYKYKVQLIESYQDSIDNLQSANQSSTANSEEHFKKLIEGVTSNFDHYERHLHYSDQPSAWPKEDDSIPYTNYQSTSQQAIDWFADKISKARIYDNNNFNILTNTVPTYLREDPDNDPYITFVNMIGHHFDNLWIYAKAVTDKYDADNRLDRGVSKDLIEEVLTSVGVKLYSSSKSIEDLFKFFTQDSYDTQGEIINTQVEVGEKYSQNDYQKQIYKRIYHNIPLLLKSKGTERGVKALINCFGIPSDILQVKYFGGQQLDHTPFFAGENPSTSSLSKIRLDNTGSIVQGDTLSQYTSIQTTNQQYTQDLHKVDIGFSPNTAVNQFIIKKLNKDFTIDDFIGDPRKGSNNQYYNLDKLSKTLLTELDTYHTKDFIRLIKFFDNVIFKMVKDFLPARTVSNTGVIIKPHLLDRSKSVQPSITFTQQQFSGSISTGFITGSDGNSFNSGSGEYSTNYINTVQTPDGKVEKAWEGPGDNKQYHRSAEEAKFDGEFSGSTIEATNRELNQNNPFKQFNNQSFQYDLRFISQTPLNICLLKVRSEYQQSNQFLLQSDVNNQDDDGDFKIYQINQYFKDSIGPIEYTSSYFSDSSNTTEIVDTESNDTINTDYNLNLTDKLDSNDNYIDLQIKAINSEIQFDQQQEQEQCAATVDFKAVFCDLQVSLEDSLYTTNQKPLPKLNQYDQFNLTSSFAQNRNINSNYYIESHNLGNQQSDIEDVHLGQLEFLNNIQLPNDNNQSIKLELIDNIDQNCKDQANAGFTNCPLYLDDTNNNLITASYSDADKIYAYNLSYIFDIPDSIDTTYNYEEGGLLYLSTDYDDQVDAFNDNSNQFFNTASYEGQFESGSQISNLSGPSSKFYKILYGTGDAQRFVNYVIEINNHSKVESFYKQSVDQHLPVKGIGNVIANYYFRIFYEDELGDRSYLLTDDQNDDTYYHITEYEDSSSSAFQTTIGGELKYSSNKQLNIEEPNTNYKPQYIFPEKYQDFYNLKLTAVDATSITPEGEQSLVSTPEPITLKNRFDQYNPDSTFSSGFEVTASIEFKAQLGSGCIKESVQDLLIPTKFSTGTQTGDTYLNFSKVSSEPSPYTYETDTNGETKIFSFDGQKSNGSADFESTDFDVELDKNANILSVDDGFITVEILPTSVEKTTRIKYTGTNETGNQNFVDIKQMSNNTGGGGTIADVDNITIKN